MMMKNELTPFSGYSGSFARIFFFFNFQDKNFRVMNNFFIDYFHLSFLLEFSIRKKLNSLWMLSLKIINIFLYFKKKVVLAP